MRGAYYNEFDPKAAAWLRDLIKQGHIADGIVDEHDLWDVSPDDLRGFTQIHLCAGIGVWSYALRAAGWADDRPVWTASFPCQPFSQAGKGKGFADERHLWPAGLHLIRELRPAIVFGEQVSSKDGLAWFDLVQADLEGEGYASGALDTCAAGVGAPHIRQRLYWCAERLADANGGQRDGLAELRGPVGDRADAGWAQGGSEPRPRRDDGLMADDDAGLEGRRQPGRERAAERPAGAGGVAGGLADPAGARHEQAGEHERGPSQLPARSAEHGGMDTVREGAGRHLPDGAGAQGEHGLREVAVRPGPTNGGWAASDWLYSRDGLWRPVEPGAQPLVDGAPARVGRLRGFGNALVAPAAQAFIEAYLDSEMDRRIRLEGVFA